MAFWSTPVSGSEPKRQYRFLIQDGASVQGQEESEEPQSAVWWWTKSAQLPSYQINENAYRLGNHHYKYPGTVTWNDIEITIVDNGNKIQRLYKDLILGGYYPDASKGDGLRKKAMEDRANRNGGFQIIVLKADGSAADTWTLKGPWIKQANFGQLDYSSDELLSLSMTICYDSAIRE